jgi:anaerobic ribonucleoside-triphosphate reductase activating protein
MLRMASYAIVFREVPDEVTLALNIAGCPNGCRGCHSPHLQDDTGEILDETLLAGLLGRYGSAATCVCFMGGDGQPEEVGRMAVFVRKWRDGSGNSTAGGGSTGGSGGRLKTAWYSGREALPDGFSPTPFDYIKLGPYVEALGGLDSPTTNQRFYRVTEGALADMTEKFRV